MSLPLLLMQQGEAEAVVATGFMAVFCCCYGSAILLAIATTILQIAGLWAVFEKAGKPGWAAIIPVYNLIVMAEVAKKEVWYGVLVLVPIVGIAFYIILVIEVAKLFGKDAMYAMGLIFLPPIFWPMLGFGQARYLGNYDAQVPPYRPGGGASGGGGWGQPPKQTW